MCALCERVHRYRAAELKLATIAERNPIVTSTVVLSAAVAAAAGKFSDRFMG